MGFHMLSTVLSTGLLLLSLAASGFALLIAVRSSSVAAQEVSWRTAAGRNLAELADKIDRSATVKLRAELDELVAAREVDQRSLRRELGKLWGRVGAATDHAGSVDPDADVDGELKAFLQLQRQHGNGSN